MSAESPFPLRLAPFELMMLLDNRPGYPMVFSIDCDFSGSICQEHFDTAVSLMLRRHPLLTARVENIGRYPHWVRADAVPAVTWSAEEPGPLTNAELTFDIRREPGLRIVVYRSLGRVRIRWHVFHACCDGIAGCAASSVKYWPSITRSQPARTGARSS